MLSEGLLILTRFFHNKKSKERKKETLEALINLSYALQ